MLNMTQCDPQSEQQLLLCNRINSLMLEMRFLCEEQIKVLDRFKKKIYDSWKLHEAFPPILRRSRLSSF